MPKHIILQKYFVYDPSVHAGDELGGLRVLEDKDNDGALHILASPLQIQWWIDQGMLGHKPLGEISDAQKKMLAQMTRGRSENLDDEDYEPGRLPKYTKSVQSGAPAFAGQPAGVRLKKRAKEAKKKLKDKGKEKPAKRPEPKAPIYTGPAE